LTLFFYTNKKSPIPATNPIKAISINILPLVPAYPYDLFGFGSLFFTTSVSYFFTDRIIKMDDLTTFAHINLNQK
jgi:hypothetical protein